MASLTGMPSFFMGWMVGWIDGLIVDGYGWMVVCRVDGGLLFSAIYLKLMPK